jgi:type IV pilus assembly protein PilY1
MVDALYGTLLWSAGPTPAANAPTPTLALSRMDHAIPSDLLVLDLDGDGYADRMYVGDMGGQLWKFDINNGATSLANLVTGGVIASLGTHDDTTHSVAATRRFYNSPDVAYISGNGIQPYFAIAIGSGYRGHPLNTGIQDYFYVLRDYSTFSRLTQVQYGQLAIIHNSDPTLVDVTNSIQPTIAAGAEGWKLAMQATGTWAGEKVLNAANIFNGWALFTTYTPSVTASSNPCLPGTGANRYYAVKVIDGSPVQNLSGGNNQSLNDRWSLLPGGGIAGGVTVAFGMSMSSSGSSSSSSGSSGSSSSSSSSSSSGGAGPNCTFLAGGIPKFSGTCSNAWKTTWKDQNAN